jgi:hypothetical protein
LKLWTILIVQLILLLFCFIGYKLNFSKMIFGAYVKAIKKPKWVEKESFFFSILELDQILSDFKQGCYNFLFAWDV